MEKSALRAHFKSIRKGLLRSSDFAIHAINRNLQLLLKELCVPGQHVFSYYAYGSEARVQHSSQVAWALPKVYSDYSMKFFEFSSKTPMNKNQYGILEPDAGKAKEVLAENAGVVLVPGLAFDQNGTRLGSGQGFYDRFLSPFPNLRKIGICFSAQLSSKDLPREHWDVPMDWLVTEKSVQCFTNKKDYKKDSRKGR